MRRSSRL